MLGREEGFLGGPRNDRYKSSFFLDLCWGFSILVTRNDVQDGGTISELVL